MAGTIFEFDARAIGQHDDGALGGRGNGAVDVANHCQSLAAASRTARAHNCGSPMRWRRWLSSAPIGCRFCGGARIAAGDAGEPREACGHHPGELNRAGEPVFAGQVQPHDAAPGAGLRSRRGDPQITRVAFALANSYSPRTTGNSYGKTDRTANFSIPGSRVPLPSRRIRLAMKSRRARLTRILKQAGLK